MVELLVVLIIVGILAAVATPLYLQNTKRAKASEAMGTLSLIRQAEREYYIKHNVYAAVSKGYMKNDPEIATNPGLGVDVGVSQYFSNDTYTVTTGASTSAPFDTTNAVDFVVTANGPDTVTCGSAPSECAVNGPDIKGSGTGHTGAYILKMDNSGTAYVSYDNGGNWSKW
jgi:type II secretory pathway pseudopilin PulG